MLGLDHTTVARRLTAFEKTLGVRLFDRSPRGMALTEAGASLIPYAERIADEMDAVFIKLGQSGPELGGTVRIATPEAFGTLIVAPHIATFRLRHSGVRLELLSEPRVVSLTGHEADIAIVHNRPPRGRFFARRLTEFRLGLYCTRDYLNEHGPIGDRDDLTQHPFAWSSDEHTDTPDRVDLDTLVPGAQPLFRSTSIAAQQAAVAGGFGIGLLHCFSAEADTRLIRIVPDIEVTRSYWLLLHAGQQHVLRVRAVVDFLDDILERHRGLL